MNFSSYGTGIGAEIIAAKYFDWDIPFVHAADQITKKLLCNNFPGIPVFTDSLPIKSVDVFFGRTPRPSRPSNSGPAKLDTDYFELALQFFEFAKKLSARWVVWEAHPSFLSSNKGKDFAEIFLHLEKLGYGFAYRVLDSIYFGVPQSRRDLYLIGYIGDWRPPSAVLFDALTGAEYRTQSEKKSLPIRTLERASFKDDLILRFKNYKESLKDICPRLPYLRETRLSAYNQHCPFIVFRKSGEVRKLTPLEWERLQGFEDNFTIKVQPIGKKRRYGLLGSSGCIPVLIWLFNRITQVEELLVST